MSQVEHFTSFEEAGSSADVAFLQNEQAAAMAAEGYFRACHRPAAVLSSAGPAAQYMLNGLAGCWFDSIPALFLIAHDAHGPELRPPLAVWKHTTKAAARPS